MKRVVLSLNLDVIIDHSQLPNNGILKRVGSIFSRIGPALLALYEKILQTHELNIATAIFQYSIVR